MIQIIEKKLLSNSVLQKDTNDLAGFILRSMYCGFIYDTGYQTMGGIMLAINAVDIIVRAIGPENIKNLVDNFKSRKSRSLDSSAKV